MGNVHFLKPRYINKPGFGVLAATGCMLNKKVWQQLRKFDERYEQGGEDGALAAKMLKNNLKIFEHPLLGTHHTHGLGLLNTIRQWHRWSLLGRPTVLDRNKLSKRRPDLNLDK